jgi:endonuclease/exonuclease/phosphatase family metal-dependent hydrolase
MVAEIVKKRTRPNSSFIILGDMNDPPDSEYLEGFIKALELNLFNALTNPKETCLDVRDPELPPDTVLTYRHKPTGQPAEYKIYDQIWLSKALSNESEGSWVDRRTTLCGDGSDHDPAWIKLKL